MTTETTLPPGFTIGHWTDPIGRTGCTVVIAAEGAVGGADVRGAASSTLATDTLRPGTLVDKAHAILLTGGSAFGLEAAGGVMRYLEEHAIGFQLADARVPIVAGAVIFDLAVGDAKARPDVQAGYAACANAAKSSAIGLIGAGTGATVAKGGDGSQRKPGGLGIACAKAGAVTVAAVMVINAVGGVWDDEASEWVAEFTRWDYASSVAPGTNTTIGAVLTDASLSKDQANRIATVAHDGIARAIRPSRTMYDGDTIFCLASGQASGAYDAVEAVATRLVAQAIAAGVRAANA